MATRLQTEQGASKKINVEIAPGNQSRMEEFIEEHNNRPDRTRTVLKYTHVINEALDFFLKKKVKK